MNTKVEPEELHKTHTVKEPELFNMSIVFSFYHSIVCTFILQFVLRKLFVYQEMANKYKIMDWGCEVTKFVYYQKHLPKYLTTPFN